MNLLHDYNATNETLKTMSDRLTEIEKMKHDSVHLKSDVKVFLKPHQALSLLDFANSLKMEDMPLNTKLRGLTNSLCPASEALLSEKEAKVKE